MKKIFSLCIAVLMLATLAGCGTKNVPLDSEWEFESYTRNFTKTTSEDIEDPTMAPMLMCDDKGNIVFSNLGVTHLGTATQDGTDYIFTFEDSDKIMRATIEGDTITVKVNGGESVVVFKAVE